MRKSRVGWNERWAWRCKRLWNWWLSTCFLSTISKYQGILIVIIFDIKNNYILKQIEIFNNPFLFLFQVFVFLLSVLVTLQQALSSGYLNSVITTIEKRYEIPSSISGIIASMYEIGNVITVIFVSYLGSRRHIPVWIGMGKNSWLLKTFEYIRYELFNLIWLYYSIKK